MCRQARIPAMRDGMPVRASQSRPGPLQVDSQHPVRSCQPLHVKIVEFDEVLSFRGKAA
jgi:hypothetical protein